MFNDDIKWRIIEHPQRVNDDQIPYSNYFITEDDVVVAEIVGDHEIAYQIVKRLNQWEEHQNEQMRIDNDSLRREMGLEDQML